MRLGTGVAVGMDGWDGEETVGGDFVLLGEAGVEGAGGAGVPDKPGSLGRPGNNGSLKSEEAWEVGFAGTQRSA